MKTGTAWIVYSTLRVLFFAVPFAIFYAIGWHWLLAAVLATLIATALSIILLSKPREQAALSIHTWRETDRMHDDIIEDAEIDGAEAGEAAPSAAVSSETTSSDAPASDAEPTQSERERNPEQ